MRPKLTNGFAIISTLICKIQEAIDLSLCPPKTPAHGNHFSTLYLQDYYKTWNPWLKVWEKI